MNADKITENVLNSFFGVSSGRARVEFVALVTPISILGRYFYFKRALVPSSIIMYECLLNSLYFTKGGRTFHPFRGISRFFYDQSFF